MLVSVSAIFCSGLEGHKRYKRKEARTESRANGRDDGRADEQSMALLQE